MMLDKDIQDIIEARPDKSPIWYGSVKYAILVKRKWIPHVAEKIVMKGTRPQILNNYRVKRSVMARHFLGASDQKGKVHGFDYNKIKLHETTINKFLGYGTRTE